jgi:hypothetical protein
VRVPDNPTETWVMRIVHAHHATVGRLPEDTSPGNGTQLTGGFGWAHIKAPDISGRIARKH